MEEEKEASEEKKKQAKNPLKRGHPVIVNLDSPEKRREEEEGERRPEDLGEAPLDKSSSEDVLRPMKSSPSSKGKGTPIQNKRNLQHEVLSKEAGEKGGRKNVSPQGHISKAAGTTAGKVKAGSRDVSPG